MSGGQIDACAPVTAAHGAATDFPRCGASVPLVVGGRGGGLRRHLRIGDRGAWAEGKYVTELKQTTFN